jgi:predicted Zn-dependent protease
MRADALLRMGARDRARRLLVDLSEREPGNWRVWLKLAIASDGLPRRRAFERARALNPLDPSIAEARAKAAR